MKMAKQQQAVEDQHHHEELPTEECGPQSYNSYKQGNAISFRLRHQK